MTSTLDRLRYNSLFEHLEDTDFQPLMENLQQRSIEKGAMILKEGLPGEELYLIADGRVKIAKRSRIGEDILLSVLHPGDFFGVMELIDGRDRSSHVVALDDCLIFSLSKNAYDKLISENHEFSVRLMQVLSVRLRALQHTFVAELERHHAKSTREFKRLQHINEITQILNSTLELDYLLNIILETALRLLDADRGTVYVIDEEHNELWSIILKGSKPTKIKLKIGQGIAGFVAATGDTVNIPDAYLDHRFNPEVDKRSGYHTKTILCMPMKNRERKIIGVIQILNKQSGPFTAEDEQTISSISIPASIAIENARLYSEEREKVAMEKDLLAAMEVQKTLLPKSIPAVTGFQFAAQSLPAKNVAGDLYDFIPIDEHRIAFSLGDVTGKGLPASLLMANAQATIRSNTFGKVTPKQCLERSNTLLFNTTSSDKFVTMFYGILDTMNHTISYSNAGQETPVIFNGDSVRKHLAYGGIPLGLLPDTSYEEEKVPLKKGDTIVLFTDGVTEAMNEQNELFTQERLLSIVTNLLKESPDIIVEKILEEIKRFTGSALQWDDITIMVIRYGG